ncbi:MAG: response regulator [Amaricoccus sp.]|uniref:response regulator n=1 Tax=Amaricoccus sp. TaxID=1872485 RepID=UPI0039E61516
MSIIDPFHDATADAERGDRELEMLRHDVRGALQGIVGGVGQIDAVQLPASMREQFERVSAAAETLVRLLGVGERFAAADAERVDLGRFVAFLRRRHAGEARERGLGFEVRVAENVPPTLALDLTPMIRIFDNLLGNALRLAGSGAVRLMVERAGDGSIVFRVVDNGSGSRPASGDRTRRADDGLGLHVVQALTERLGGQVQIASRSGGGAEAEVRFPAQVAVKEAPPAAATNATDLSGLRVLLAEDNPTNQMVASQMLRALNAEVFVCGDGVEALDRFDRDPVDLVVVDIEMPRLSGLDVIRAIRARSDERAQVPIVALTAYAMREHRERIAAAGANGLISKPIVSVEALGRALAGCVARRTPPRAAAAAEAAPAAVAGPVIDQATFDALAEAIGADTMAELVEKVVADLQSAQAALTAATPQLERAAIRSASHILISVAGAVGAVRLQASARALNTLAHGEAADRISEELRRCIDEIDAAVAFANDWRSEGR